ncbi:siderophore ABC transporter substrate-binding protein [Bacillus testis]|uniref:siderophore ABC transporter substrate-binding protein n=1 Tax=Bacillus testis TaxID=1622072 RepID=UPI00067F0A06|nr:siderophore ABC transporter substrate-binding protein [Bacillus testis]
MKKSLIAIMFALFTIVLAACGAQDDKKDESNGSKEEQKTITVKHDYGETKVPANPKKVVVFDFGTLDTMNKLGIDVTGVPQDNVPSYLKEYKDSKYKNVGGLKEPDFEAINEIQPDLIIISGRQADSYDKFSEIAPTIYMGVDTKDYMKSFESNVKTIGQIFDKEKQANKELSAVKDSVQQLKDKVDPDKKGLIILASGGKISAYGTQSRFGIIHDEFGVTPSDKNIDSKSPHGQTASFEYVLKQNPDYLFVVDRDKVVTSEDGKDSGAKKTVENDLVKKTNAYKDGHIVYLDPNYWYLSGGGLESVAEMVNEVSSAITK